MDDRGSQLAAHGGRVPRWAWIGLLAVFAFALWLRLGGIDWLLPYYPEPDNLPPLHLAAVEAGIPPEERGELLRRYPYLLADIAWLIPAAKIPATDDIAAHLWAASTVTLRVRIVNAILSAVLVLLTWRLARRFVAQGTALLACAFVATSLLHILFSQQARPHGIHATLAILAVIAALRMREKPGWWSYVLAGTACGLALACLQNGVATLLPLAAAHVLRERGGAQGSGPGRGARWWRIAVPLAIVGILAWSFYPHHGQLRPQDQDAEFVIDSGGIVHRGHRIAFTDLNGHGFVLTARYLLEHDPTILILAVLGIVLALPAFARRWKDKELAVVLAYVLPYLGAVGIFNRTYDRFLLPLLPFLAILAAFAAARCAELLGRIVPAAAARRLLPAAAAVAALAFPTYASLKFASVRDAPDTVEQAAAWIRENVRPEEGDILVTPSLTLPLFHDPAKIDPDVPPPLYGAWVRYQAGLPASSTRGPCYRLVNIPPKVAVKVPAENPGLAEKLVDEWNPAYAVLEVSPRVRHIQLMGPIGDLIRSRGERVFLAWSEPDEVPELRPLAHQDMPHMLDRLLRVRCFGPRVEIWKLRER